MKTVFINVPQWYPMNPYLSGAVLAGQLKHAGLEATTFDANIAFFNRVLTRAYVSESAKKAKEILHELTPFIQEIKPSEESFSTCLPDVQTKILRYKTIFEYFKNGDEKLNSVIDGIDDAVAVMKDKRRFYEPETLFKAKDMLSSALQIISLPYAPAKILLDNYIANPVLTFNYEDVKAQCFDKSQNMFIDFFEELMPDMPLTDCSLAGISVTDLSQLIPALTLGRLIKERLHCKVCLGGNYIFKIITEIKQTPEFFRSFCDFVSVGDGEIAAVDLAEYMEGKRTIRQVRSLVWYDGNAIIENAKAPLLKLDELSYPDFDGYDFSDYFSPDIVLPVQFGKGCYWGKCEFCDFYTGQQKFDIKSPERAADEVEYLCKKYGVSHFIFVDEAVPPKFYSLFADEVIKRGLKIHFYSFARFENGFTRDVLEKLHSAGGEYFSWGFEAASDRLLQLMNKGIRSDVRMRILKDCVELGMWTQCTFLLGYPTETPEELQQTIDVIENRALINSCTPSNFALKKNAILSHNTDMVGITDFRSNGDFHVSCSYQSKGISMTQVKKNRLTFEKSFLERTADCLWSLGFTDTDHLLLYLSKFGRDYVRDYRLSYKKEHP